MMMNSVGVKSIALRLEKSQLSLIILTGVRCNAICPGWVDTPINYAHAKMLGGLDHVYKTIDSFQPIGRPGTPREIANLVLFLASDESSFMTGSIVSADGGMTAQ
jgi:dihydroanticapsin dehydrogenase